MKNYKVRFLLLILFSIIIFSSCMKQYNVEELKLEVSSINNILSKAILEQDHERVFSLYTNDAISLPSYSPMIRGLDAIKAHAEKSKEKPMKMNTFTLESTDVWVSGKFVIDIGVYSLSMDMPDSPSGDYTDNGKYVTVFEIQENGSLLMKADTWNTDHNPWMQMKEQHADSDSTMAN